MEYINRTRFPGHLFRTAIDDDRIAASLLLRVTYDIRNGELVPSDEQPWVASARPFDTEYGVMPSDQVFYRDGVDILIFGNAWAPEGRKVSELDVTVEVGDSFRRTARIIGPRVWYRGVAGLVPSAPAPFTSIPLTVTHAYGGKERWDGTEIPFAPNPDGTGFYMTEEDAEGQPLPCIEDARERIATWSDRPAPMGFGFVPQNASPWLPRVAQIRHDDSIRLELPPLFNSAFPSMVAPRVGAGDGARISGASSAGTLSFRIPCALPVARLRFGSSTTERRMPIDQIGVEVEQGRIFVSYRYPFRYVVRPHQKRILEVYGI